MLEKASTQPGHSFDFGQAFGDIRSRSSREFADLRDRWVVGKSNIFLAALVMAGLAFVIATIAGPSLLVADATEDGSRADSAVWLQLALGLALGAAALAVFIRWQSGPPRESALSDIDFKVGVALAGITAIFALLGLLKGLDGRSDGVYAWFRYADAYMVLVIAIFAVSRPIPKMLRTTPSTTIGLIAVGVAAGALVLGQIFALSNNVDTFTRGVAFQEFGIVAMTLSLGWFLGLKPVR